LFFLLGFWSHPSIAQKALIGVNIVNPQYAPDSKQAALIAELQANHVRAVRFLLGPGDRGVLLADQISQAGISIDLVVNPQYPKRAPVRRADLNKFPGMWSGPPLSEADVSLSFKYFQNLFKEFDRLNIHIAAIELGNEINWAAYNRDFFLPGEGKVLNLSDLSDDLEGRKIAIGLKRYIEIMRALKYARDLSNINKNTVLLAAGLSDVTSSKLSNHQNYADALGLAATIQYLKKNGLNSLIDGYAIHIYPSDSAPGNKKFDTNRIHKFETDMSACAIGGKPCWITEWGFPNKKNTCPVDDSTRKKLVQQMLSLFQPFIMSGRLKGIFLFAWSGDPREKALNLFSVYRCNKLTSAGRLALAISSGDSPGS
jgi:hypothetical protein